MNLLLLNFFLVAAYCSGFQKIDIAEPWELFKKEHDLKFEPSEDKERREIFAENKKFIDEHNKKQSSFKLALNKFAHMTHGEFLSRNKHIKTVEIPESPKYESLTKLVWTSIDWRQYGVVSPVIDQARCGSAYAISGVSAVESHLALRSGVPLHHLSPQEIIDCSRQHGNLGCHGGYAQNAFQYIVEHGISNHSHYEYTASNKVCQVKQTEGKRKISGFAQIKIGDEHELLRAVSSYGPVSLSIDSRVREMQFYKSGIIDLEGCSSKNLDHHVTAVGYDLTEEIPHLIVKNSWGTQWGEDGFFKIRLYKNMCGIASDAVYPIV